MVKKGLLVLIIVALVAGGAFAQNSFSSMAKNTITVDVGPTIVGFGIGPALNLVGGLIGMEGLTANGLGFAGQYERQLSQSFSVAGRGSYLKTDLSLALDGENNYGSGTLKTNINLSSFSGEGHVRFYPLGETFFLDGMVGYAQLNTDFSGNVNPEGSGGNIPIQPFTAVRSYVILGAKVGWRISFGKNGGFTFEPSIGGCYGIGLGDSIEDQFAKKLEVKAPDINQIFPYIENLIFISGPRVSLAFGYRF